MPVHSKPRPMQFTLRSCIGLIAILSIAFALGAGAGWNVITVALPGVVLGLFGARADGAEGILRWALWAGIGAGVFVGGTALVLLLMFDHQRQMMPGEGVPKWPVDNAAMISLITAISALVGVVIGAMIGAVCGALRRIL